MVFIFLARQIPKNDFSFLFVFDSNEIWKVYNVCFRVMGLTLSDVSSLAYNFLGLYPGKPLYVFIRFVLLDFWDHFQRLFFGHSVLFGISMCPQKKKNTTYSPDHMYVTLLRCGPVAGLQNDVDKNITYDNDGKKKQMKNTRTNARLHSFF